MNIFFIPSWYPSLDHPIDGIFIHDQIEGITTKHLSLNAGVSIWGQKDENLLLYSREPFTNVNKILRKRKIRQCVIGVKKNFTKYYKPTFTWTKLFANGNIEGIIKANNENFQLFERQYGRVHIIHAFVTYPGGFIAMKLAEKYKIPYIITEQVSPFRPDIFLNLRSKVNDQVIQPLKNASKIVAISPSSVKELESFIASSPICIPNMVNEDFFMPQPTSKKEKGNFTFFSLGRNEEQKGFPDLLKAWANVEKKYPGVNLRIGGDGSKHLLVRKMSENLQLKNVVWLGELTREKALSEFQKCDAFVLASLHESMGVVFAEALACGKPVITTLNGGAESIVNQQNGLLANTNDPTDLTLKILSLIENYDLYNPDYIRKDFLERFSYESVSNRIVKLYKNVINSSI